MLPSTALHRPAVRCVPCGALRGLVGVMGGSKNSLCSRYFAHIAMMNTGHLSVIPGDGDSIPTRFNDLAAVITFALPTDANAYL